MENNIYTLPQLSEEEFMLFVKELFIGTGLDYIEIDSNILFSAKDKVKIKVLYVSIDEIEENVESKINNEFEKQYIVHNDNLDQFFVITNYEFYSSFKNDAFPSNYLCLGWLEVRLLYDFLAINLSSFPKLRKGKIRKDYGSLSEKISFYKAGVELGIKLEIKLLELNYRYFLAEIYSESDSPLLAIKEYDYVVNTIESKRDGKNIPNEYYELFVYSCISIILVFIDTNQNERIFATIQKLEYYWIDKVSDKLLVDFYIIANNVYDRLGKEKLAFNYYKKIQELDDNQRQIYESTNETIEFLFNQKTSKKYQQKLKNPNAQIGLPRLIKEYTPNSISNKENEPLDFAIKQFHIQNYHCIKEIKQSGLEVDAPWIFITGRNGTGKTSILQAIAAGLTGETYSDFNPKEEGKRPVIGIELLREQKNQIHTLGIDGGDWSFREKEIKDTAPVVLAYGVSRLGVQSEEKERRELEDKHTFSLFRPQEGNLGNIEAWLKNQALKNGKNDSKQTAMVKQTLVKLMPSVMDIILNLELLDAAYEYLENGVWNTLDKLASGNKTILATVGDMLIRLLSFYPKAESTKDFKGIIIIDELDMHLHPHWQKEFPWLLTEIFPGIQFICSTHSIVPLMGAPRGSIFLTATRDEEGTHLKRMDFKIEDFSPQYLLSSPLFDLPLTTKLAEEEGTEDEYNTAEDFNAKDRSRKVTAALKSMQSKENIFGDDLFKK